MKASRWISARDLVRLSWLGFADVLVRILPASVLGSVAQRLGDWAALLRPARTKTSSAKIKGFFPGGPPNHENTEALLRRIGRNLVEEAMLNRRLAHRSGWRPEMRIVGSDLVESRLADGGVMLWAATQIFNMQLTVMIAHDAGWPVHRLSHWTHGPAGGHPPTKFALRMINAPWQRVEDQYATRLVIPQEGHKGTMEAFEELLKNGQIVVVSSTADSRTPLTEPLFDGWIRLALGAAKKARECGASIVATKTLREDDGTFVITFVPIMERNEDQPLEVVARRMIRVLSDAMRNDPSLWSVNSSQTFLSPNGSTK